MSVLTQKQMERRSRVIGAATRLAAEGGYDAVQMRDVAAEANVSLGTIYRYFSSKDHLLASAMGDWLGELESRFGQRPPRGDTAADQVIDVFERSIGAVQRQPQLMAALIRAVSSTDAGVADATIEVHARLRGLIEEPLRDFDPEIREAIITNVRSVWFTLLVLWIIGRIELSDVADEIERMVRLVVTPYEQGTSARLRKGSVEVARDGVG